MDSRYLVAATAVGVASAGFLTGSPALAADPVKIKPLVVAPAANPLSGYLGAYVGVGHFDSGSKYSTGFHVLGGAGALNYWLSPNRSLQFDVYGSGTGKFAAAIHHTHRSPTSLWGLMFALGSSGNGGGWIGNVAIEGQMYHGSNGVLLYGQAGVTFGLEGSFGAGVYAGGEARWFTTPDTKWSLDLRLGQSPGGSSTLFSAGAMVEHKLAGMPISVFARGQYDVDHYSNTDHAITGFLGINFIINQQSLKAQSQNGATLWDMNPIFGQFANQAW